MMLKDPSREAGMPAARGASYLVSFGKARPGGAGRAHRPLRARPTFALQMGLSALHGLRSDGRPCPKPPGSPTTSSSTWRSRCGQPRPHRRTSRVQPPDPHQHAARHGRATPLLSATGACSRPSLPQRIVAPCSPPKRVRWRPPLEMSAADVRAVLRRDPHAAPRARTRQSDPGHPCVFRAGLRRRRPARARDHRDGTGRQRRSGLKASPHAGCARLRRRSSPPANGRRSEPHQGGEAGAAAESALPNAPERHVQRTFPA